MQYVSMPSYKLSLIVIRADWAYKVKRRAKVAYFLYMASVILKIVSLSCKRGVERTWVYVRHLYVHTQGGCYRLPLLGIRQTHANIIYYI